MSCGVAFLCNLFWGFAFLTYDDVSDSRTSNRTIRFVSTEILAD